MCKSEGPLFSGVDEGPRAAVWSPDWSETQGEVGRNLKSYQIFNQTVLKLVAQVLDKDNLVNKARNLGVRASQHTAKVINQVQTENKVNILFTNFVKLINAKK